MKIKETFTTGNGWRHSLLFLGLINILMYWSVSNHAHSTKLFPSSMMADLSNQLLFWQLFIYSFFAFCAGWLIEWHESEIWKADFSWSDIWWGVLAVPFAFTLSLYLPHNAWVLAFSIVAVLFANWHFAKQFYVKKK